MAGRDTPRTFVSPSTSLVTHLYCIIFYSRRYVALKICIADADPNYELEIFNKLSATPPVPPNVVQLLDNFSLQGPNGLHTILVLNVLGNFMDFVRPPNGPGRKHVRILCRDIAVGLAALHRQGIVHGGMCAVQCYL